jgi:predicted transposase YdaD
MKESSTYQKILREGREVGREEGREEGRANEARAIIKRQGTRRFGKPAAEYELKLDTIADVERLEELTDRILDATSWDDLFKPARN